MSVQWTVGKKLAAGFGLALLLLLLIGSVSYWNINLLVETSDKVTHTYRVLENLERLISLLKDAETGTRGFLLTGDELFLAPYNEAAPLVAARLGEVRDLTSDNPAQQDGLKALGPLLDQRLHHLGEQIRRRRAQTGKDADADARMAAELRQSMEQGRAQMVAIRKSVDDLKAAEHVLLEKRAQTEQTTLVLTRLVILVGSLAALVALSLFGWYITRGITGPLRELSERSRRIAAGDLKATEQRIASTDEIGALARTFDGMVDGLRNLTRQTVGVTGNLGAAAAQIRASIQQQATGTREQAASVQEITTTMEEVNQSGAQIQAKAKQVAAAAEATSAASTAGLDAVRGTTRTMEGIRAQVEQVAENIVALSEKTQAVGEIIATVTDVAERSNLLALNAAIEAAAAGEQGSRFAVVAGEMKSLADQAKESTVQVRTILGDIQKGINASVMLTEEAVKRVEAGRHQAEVAEEVIRRMSQTTLESIQAFEQILAAGNQQQIGFEQVAQGMKDIRQAAAQTATATGELEKAAVNLNALSQELTDAVGRYQL